MPGVARVGLVVGLALATTFGSVARVGAAPRRGVIVRAVAGAPAEAEPVESAVAAAVRGGGVGAREAVVDVVAVARARLASGAVERARLADFARARELAREGWRAYLKVDPTFAEAQLVNARRTLEAVLDLDGALDLFADVSIRLGAVRLNTGRAEEARAAFVLAATLDPERELTAQEFAPAVIAAYKQATAAGGVKVALELLVGTDVDVELDGVGLGRGARSVRVAAGEHVVVARAPGRRSVGQVLAVPAAGARVELPLEDDVTAATLATRPAPLAIGTGERVAVRAVDALATYADLDDVLLVVVTWRGGQPALLGQRCALAPVACTPVREVRFASLARLGGAAGQLTRDLEPPIASGAPALGPIVFEDTRATEPEPPRHAGAGSGGDAPRVWWKNGWLWAGVGAAVVVAGGAVWLLADTGPGSVEVTLPPVAQF